MYPGHHARTCPDKPAVVMGSTGEQISYRELDERSNRLTQLWWSLGLRGGDQVALLAENHPRYYEVYWAALRSGLYITGVNRHSTAEEASYVVNDCGAGVLVATRHLAHIAQGMLPLLDGCPHRLMIDGAVDGFSSYEDAVAGHPEQRLAREPRGEVMLYSLGNHGAPEGGPARAERAERRRPGRGAHLRAGAAPARHGRIVGVPDGPGRARSVLSKRSIAGSVRFPRAPTRRWAHS